MATPVSSFLRSFLQPFRKGPTDHRTFPESEKNATCLCRNSESQ